MIYKATLPVDSYLGRRGWSKETRKPAIEKNQTVFPVRFGRVVCEAENKRRK